MIDSLWLPNHVIDDATSVRTLDSDASQMGYAVQDYEERQTGWLDGVGARLDIPLIPESEWKERIEERERKDLTNRAVRESYSIPSLDQNGYPYCWAHGPTQAMCYWQVKAGEPKRQFSAISVAAPVKNFAKVGGWGDQALAYIAENGINYADDWPINAHDRRYFNAENKAKAKENRVTEWWDLKPRDFPELVTCLLNGFPVSVAYNWWRHLVCAIDVVVKGGEVCVLIDNSWGSRWGDNGLSVLCGSKKYADEAIALRVQNARAA